MATGGIDRQGDAGGEGGDGHVGDDGEGIVEHAAKDEEDYAREKGTGAVNGRCGHVRC